MSATANRHYVTLDALRGVAALAVMAYHLGTPLGAHVLPSAYIAVDFFFILSGFVIAHAYEARLRDSMSAGRFIVVRLVRLYPLYVAGIAIGLFYILGKSPLRPDEAVPADALGLAALLGALFLPTFRDAPHLQGLFPFNGAAWSLFFELVINVFYALSFRFWTTRRLTALTAIAATGLVVCAWIYGSLDIGMNRETFLGGFVRVAFGFPLGVLIYRLRARLPRIKAPSLALLALTLLLAAVDLSGPWRAAFDLTAALVWMPLIVLIGAQNEPEVAAPAYRVLGDLSYPVYALHTPLMLIWLGVVKIATNGVLPTGNWAAYGIGALCFGLTIAASYVALKLYDMPVRRYLNGLLRRAPAPA